MCKTDAALQSSLSYRANNKSVVWRSNLRVFLIMVAQDAVHRPFGDEWEVPVRGQYSFRDSSVGRTTHSSRIVVFC